MRAARRDAGSDVEDTTSESEIEEPQLHLPPDMDGPAPSASMADLTSMRWVRGVPRNKTFELTERHAKWRKDQATMTARAQRRLKRRIARGKESWERDGQSEDSETEPVQIDEPGASPAIKLEGAEAGSRPEEEAGVVGNIAQRPDVHEEEEEVVLGSVDGAPEQDEGEHEDGGPAPSSRARGTALDDDAQALPSPRLRKFQESGSTAQFRIRDDGTIDVDPDSLLVDRNKEAWDQANDGDLDPTVIGDEWTFTNSASFASTTRRGKSLAITKDGESAVARGKRWSKAETQQFISAVRLWGTDFGMVARAFPSRTRTQIVAKWRKMEAEDPAALDAVFAKKIPLKRSATPASSRASTPQTGPEATRSLTPALGRGTTPASAGISHPHTQQTAVSTPCTGVETPAPEGGEQTQHALGAYTAPDKEPEARAESQALTERSPSRSPSRCEQAIMGEAADDGQATMTLEDWARVAKVDLDMPTPTIDLPAHVKATLEAEVDDTGSSHNQAMKRSQSQVDDEWEEEEEIEIGPDGTRTVTVHRVKKRRVPQRRGKKVPQAREMIPSRDHVHRADVLARQAGIAAGESEEFVGPY